MIKTIVLMTFSPILCLVALRNGQSPTQKFIENQYFHHKNYPVQKSNFDDMITTVSADFLVLSGKSRKLAKRWKRSFQEDGNNASFLSIFVTKNNNVSPRELESFTSRRLNDLAVENKDKLLKSSKSYKSIGKPNNRNEAHSTTPVTTRFLTSSTDAFVLSDYDGTSENDISSYGFPENKQNSIGKSSKSKVFGASSSSESINHSTYNYGSASGKGLSRDSPPNPPQETTTELDPQQQVITGIPDLSDPCFRRYSNSIIVNAQPYERRSSISLVNCKSQCLRSQLGVYSCRSFIYDNINQVCDLFAHVGDQPPARLLRFQTRDYFEPTSAIHCTLPLPVPSAHQSDDALATAFGAVSSAIATPPAGSKSPSQLTALPQASATAFPAIVQPAPPQPLPTPASTQTPTPTLLSSGPGVASIFEQSRPQQVAPQSSNLPIPPLSSQFQLGGNDLTPLGTSSSQLQTTQTLTTMPPQFGQSQLQVEPAKEEIIAQCNPTQVARFLKTQDFELHAHDDVKLRAVTMDECMNMCARNMASRTNASSIRCNSFEFTSDIGVVGECVLSMETAVPLGNGQLKQKIGTDYFEKICVDQRDCPGRVVYNRFPQMILVGFAETVVDAPSLQNCFDNCLNSRRLYGFRCTSGMFYFEEPQLNCILNTEDRTSQPELFTAESSDLVDYFEVGAEVNCTASAGSPAPVLRFKSFSSVRKRPPMAPANVPRSQFSKFGKVPEKERNLGGGIRGFLKAKDFVELIPPPSTASIGQNRQRGGPLKSRVRPPSRSPPERIGWTEWSVCGRSSGGRKSNENLGLQNFGKSEHSPTIGTQTRWKICVDQRVCAKEERQCQVLGNGKWNGTGTGTIVATTNVASNKKRATKIDR